MADSVFRNMLLGFQSGNELGESRRRRNALVSAGQRVSSGDAVGGANQLYAQGMFNEGNQLQQVGEVQRSQRLRTGAGEAYRTGGTQALQQFYGNEGEVDQALAMEDRGQDQEERKRRISAQTYEFFGTTAASLAGMNLPPEQAKQRALQAVQASPYANQEVLQQLQALPAEQFTPQALTGFAEQFGMEASQILGRREQRQERQEDMQYRDSRDQVEDRRWGQSFGLQQRQVANQERAAREPRAAPPLRGADKQLMDSVRDTATSGRGLRALAQEFRSTIAGQPTGPIDGATWNPGTYFNSQQTASRALASRMTGLMRPTGSGATSDFEQRLYQRGAPSLDKPAEANELIINGMETLGRLSDARQFFYEDYAEAYGSLNGAERAFQSSPEFKQLTQEADQGDGAAPPGRARGGFNNADPLGIRGR